MSKRVFFEEYDGDVVQLDGRKVTWLMKAAAADAQYTSVCVVEYEPGRRAKPSHAHPLGEETVYIAAGHGKAKIGDEICAIHPGMLVHFPQGVQHMLWNTGTETLKGICFYAPAGGAIDYQFDPDFDFPEFQAAGQYAPGNAEPAAGQYAPGNAKPGAGQIAPADQERGGQI